MKTFYTCIHSLRFCRADAHINQFYFLIKGFGIGPCTIVHLFYISSWLKKSCAAKSSDISKLVKIGHGGLKRLKSTHRQSSHGTMVTIGECPESFIDHWNDFLNQNFGKN